jgi:hypothetical protein
MVFTASKTTKPNTIASELVLPTGKRSNQLLDDLKKIDAYMLSESFFAFRELQRRVRKKFKIHF